MKILIIFLSFFTSLLANQILINNDFSLLTTVNQQIVIEDEKGSLSINEILENNNISTYSKSFTKFTNSTFWTKVKIKNIDKIRHELIFKNPRAGIDQIDVYIYQNQILKTSYQLGDLREQKLHPISSVKSVFYATLNLDEEITVITRFKSTGPMYLGWEILTPQKYSYTNLREISFYAMFGGLLIALIIYNMVMFFNLKEKTFLFYSLHGITFLWFQYSYNGMFYFLDLGFNLFFLTISNWLAFYFIVSFLLLFTINFFNLKENNKFLYKLFNFIIICLFLIAFATAYLFWDSSLVLYTPYSIMFILLILFIIFIVSIYAFYKKISGAIYFLIGEGVYLSFTFYSIFIIGGETDTSNNLQYILVPFGILIEMIFLSIALGVRVGKIKKDNSLINKILNEEEKFSSVGKSIANLTHQWKKPISQLSSQLMYLETLHFLKKDEMLLSELGTNIEQMNTVIKYMKDSVDEIYDFYSNSEVNSSASFDLKKQIDMVLRLQSNSIILSKIDVHINCQEDISVLGSKHSFSNILMILFDNSINQFSLYEIEKPIISINVKVLKNSIKVVFSDNAGGFDSTVIDKIFIIPYTSKGENGSGLGLILAKKLIEERLNGKISVKNIEKGASFRMILRI